MTGMALWIIRALNSPNCLCLSPFFQILAALLLPYIPIKATSFANAYVL